MYRPSLLMWFSQLLCHACDYIEATLKKDANYTFSSAEVTQQNILICLTRRLPFSVFVWTFFITQAWSTFILFLRTTAERELLLYSTESIPLHHSTLYLCIYPPKAILVYEIPWEENALSHSLYLLVLDWCWCVRAGQWMGGWQIDRQWMSVRGILTFTTAFHTLS